MNRDRQKFDRLAERLPVADWLARETVREVEHRLTRYGLSRSQARRAIWKAKQR